MTTETMKALEVFYSYAQQDEPYRNELEKHLSILKRQGFLATWHYRKITAGTEWECEIDKHLNKSQLILLLISPDFIASDYCYDVEVKRALERHELGEARVIPIILRPIEWQYTPFGKLQALPSNNKPVISWSGRAGRDNAFQDIAKGIRAAVKELQSYLMGTPLVEIDFDFEHLGIGQPSFEESSDNTAKKSKYYWLNEATKLYGLKEYAKAIDVLDEFLQSNPNTIPIYISKLMLLRKLHRYDQILEVCEQVLLIDSNHVTTYSIQGDTFCELRRYAEALAAYESAIRIYSKHFQSQNLPAYIGKGAALESLGREEEARIAFQIALAGYDRLLRTGPNKNVFDYNGKAEALYKLKRFEEALEIYEQSLNLEKNNPVACHGTGLVLESLGRQEEAQKAFQIARQLGYESG
jgi:tetratricopeptide (TPR) repeat protein